MATLTSTLRVQLQDAVSGPSKGAAASLKALENTMSRLGKSGAQGAKNLVGQLEYLRKKSAAVGEFKSMRRGLADSAVQFRKAREEAKKLQEAFSSTVNPTKKMQNELNKAQNAVRKANDAFKQQRDAVRNAEQSLRAYSLNSRSGIARSQQEIRNQLAKTIREMRRMDQEERKPKPQPKRRPTGSPFRTAADAVGGYAATKLAQTGPAMVQAGAERASAVNRLRNVGASPAEMMAAQAAAAEVSQRFPMVSQEDALNAWLETRSINGADNGGVDLAKARKSAILLAQAKTALASSGEDLSEEDIKNLAAVQEGSGRGSDPNGQRDVLDAYIRGKQVFGPLVSSEALKTFVANAKSANFSMSGPAFLRTAIARLSQGNAARLGNETAQTMSSLVGGHMTKQGMEWLVKHGLLGPEQVKKGGGGKYFIEGGVKDADLLSADPTLWAQKVLMPGIQNSGELSDDAIKRRKELLRAGSPGADEHTLEEKAIHAIVADSLQKTGLRSTVTDNLAHSIGNEIIIRRQVEQLNAAKGLDAAGTVGGNPLAAWQELTASLSNLGAVVTGPAVAAAGPVLHDIAGGIASVANAVQEWQRNHPDLAKPLGVAVPAATTAGGVWAAWESGKALLRRFRGGKDGGGTSALEEAASVAKNSGLGGTLLRGLGKGLLAGLIEQLGENAIQYGLDRANDRLYTPDQQMRARAARTNALYPWQSAPWVGPGSGPDEQNPDDHLANLDGYLTPPRPGGTGAGVPPDKSDEARTAATTTMQAYNDGLAAGLAQTEAIIKDAMQRIFAAMTQTFTPTIRPKVDMSAITGVHADTGVH